LTKKRIICGGLVETRKGLNDNVKYMAGGTEGRKDGMHAGE